ncbi:MAG: choice-of-anchor tandem repeat GloVer-containing protein [Bryobacteraceae bacterium]
MGPTTCKKQAGGTETVLHTFTGGEDGGEPYAGLMRDSAGNLYGTTYGGGISTNGVVFKITPP